MKRDLPKKISSDRLLKINRRTVFLRKINRRTVFLRKINRRTVFLRKISETAKKVGASPDTLRRWEKEGKITPIRTKGGTRLYPDFVKIGKAAKTLGVSIDTLRRWERSGKITTIRTPGGTRLYSLDNLQKINPFSKVKTPPTETISDHIETNKPPSVPKTTSDLLENIEEIESPLKDFQKTPYLTTVTDLSPPQPIPPTYIKKIYARIYARIYASRMIFQKNGFVFFLFTLIITASLLIGVRMFGSNLSYQKTVTPPADVLAITSSSKFLEVNSDTQINGSLSTTGRINELLLEATPSAGTLALSSGDTRLSVTNDALIDQDVSTTASPTFNALNLSSTNNQLIFQSGGPTGTLTWTPTTNQVINLPDLASTLSTTLVGTNTTQTLINKTISGASNTLSNIPNSALSNSKVTVTAGTNLSGGGDVSLGSSITINLKDAVSLASTLAVTGATTLSSTVTVSGISSGSGSTVCVNSSNQLVSCATGSAIAGSGTTNYISKFSSASAIGNSSIFDNGNVGIGTSAPSQTFQVNTNTSNPIVMTSGGNVGIGFTSPNSALSVGSANQFAINSSGNLTRINNIPYSFPSSQAAAVNYVLANDSSGNLSWAAVAGVGGVTGTGNSGGVTYWTGTSTVSDSIANFYWDSTNNRLGIGTSSPQYRLDVSGTGYFSGFVGIGSSLNVTGNVGIGSSLTTTGLGVFNGGLNVTGLSNLTGNVGVGSSLNVSSVIVGSNGLVITGTGAFTGRVSGADANSSNEFVTLSQLQGGSGSLWQDGGDYLNPNSTFATNVRIPAGNLGIGTSATSGSTLQINGNGVIGWGTAAVAGPASGLAVFGNVGVGTTSPLGALHVVGQCVAKGTRIRRRRRNSKGEWEEEDIPVEDIKPDDEILSLDDKTGEWEWHKVEKTWDKGKQTVYRLETETGKWIETTANHPYLMLEEELFNKEQIDQENQQPGNQHQTKSYSSFNVDIFNVNFPVNNFSNHNYISFLNINAAAKQIIPNPILTVNNQGLSFGLLTPHGIKIDAANQPADRLINKSDNVITNVLSTLKSISQAKWTKVSELSVGQYIATADSWEKVVSIHGIGRKQTYDLQIEETHNFVGNDIVAHNTYITGNVGIGFTTPDRMFQLSSDINIVGSNASLLGTAGTQFAITGSTANNLLKKLVLGIDTTDNYGVIQAGAVGTNYNLALNPAGGNIGIGQTSPADRLHISGFLRTDDVAWASNNNFGSDLNVVLSMAVFNGKLYAGMGSGWGDADVYVYDGSTWTLSNDPGAGARQTKSLAVYNGKLYAGTWASANDYGDVYVYNGSTWSLSNDFGTAIEEVNTMAVYNGKLYTGVGNGGGDVEVHVYDGSTWSLSNDFGANLNSVYALAVYNGKLYAGVGGGTAGTGVYVYDGSTWSLSNDFGADTDSISSLAVYNGKLYAGTSIGDAEVHVYDGSTWSTSTSLGASYGAATDLAVYNGKLYAGTSTDGDVFVYDGSSWSLSYNQGGSEVGALAVYNGKLYAGGVNTTPQAYVYSERLESQLAKEFNPAVVTPFNEQYQHFLKDITMSGNLGVGGSLVVTGNVGVGRSLTVTDLGVFNKGINVSGLANLTGNVGIGSSLTTTGLGVFNGGLNVSGLSNLTGNVGIGGSLTVTSAPVFSALGLGVVQSNASGALSSGPINLASSSFVSGILPVVNGGTGTGTFTSNGVLYGNGTSAIQVTSGGGTNSVLTANGGAPSFSSTPTLSSLTLAGNNNALIFTGSTPSISSNTSFSIFPQAGNVGIGTSTTSYLLDVAGTGRFTGFVGIGSSLNVAGNVGIGQSLTVTSAAALSTLNTTGLANLASLNVTGISQLTGNVGIGSSLTTTGLGVFNGGLNVSGLANLTGNVGIGGSLTTNSLVTLNNSSTGSGTTLCLNSSNQIVQCSTGSSIGGTGAAGAVSYWTSSNNLSNSVANFYWDSANFRLGIGNSAPTGIFQVGSSTAAPPLYVTGITGNVGIGTTGPSQLFQVNSSSSNPVVITSGGNMGIGFTTPDRKLQIGADITGLGNALGTILGAGGSQLDLTGSTANTLGKKLALGIDTSNNVGFIQTGASLGVGTTSAYTLSLNPLGGNVGIGTTSPGSKLDISGDASVSPTASALRFSETSGQGTSRNWLIGNGSGPSYGDLVFLVSAATGGNPASGGTQVMTITGGGNVGIGATTSNNKLDVWGGARITSGLTLEGLSSAAATALCINSSNQVVTCSGSSALTGTGVSGGVTYWNGASSLSNSIANFYWDSTNNRLGVGNSSPQYRLDVTGTGYFSGFVGIGSSLSVSGNVGIGQSLAVTSAAALSTLNTTGLANLASLNVNGTTSITDTSNTLASLSLSNNTATTIGNGGNTLGVIDLGSTSLTTGNFMNIELNGLSTGKGINLTSTSTALTTGNLMSIDWSPGSATTATSGDLFKITIGTNGTLSSGNLFNIVDTTSSIFSVSESSFITSLPASFNAAGDVSIAYDLNFTNPTASYIKSNAPLYITAGKVFNSSDLTLTTYNQGQIFLNSAAGVYAIGNVGIGVSMNAVTMPTNGMAIQGNVGIGASTANSTLSVAGSAHIGSTRQGIAAPTDGLFVDGNVGIGATTSNNKLDVWGNARITGTLTVDSTAIVGVLNATSAIQLGGNNINTAGTLSNVAYLNQANVFTQNQNFNAGFDVDDAFVVADGGALTTSQSVTLSGNNNALIFTGSTPSISSNTSFSIFPQAGNVGIGTSTTSYLLDVAGTGRFTGFVGIGSSLNVAGNVGIGSSLTVTSGVNLSSSLNVTGNTNLTTANATGLAITNTSNTVAALSLTNNTATTIGNGGNTLGVIDLQSTSLTTGNFLNIELNGLSSGKGLNLTSTSTAFSSGTLLNLDWSPTTATTATGNLLNIGIGVSGTAGNLLNIQDTGSSIFSISESSFITSLPASFNAPGDVAIAYDINFTNPTASYIKSAAPLYITSGEVFNSSDLTLTTYNQGQIFLNSAAGVYAIGNVGIGVSMNAVTMPTNGMAIQGNVGIGASTANSTLSVAGSAHIGSTRQGVAAPTDGLLVDGNVGIGVTTASQRLEVGGRIRMGTWTADGTTAIYYNAANGDIGLQSSDIRLKTNITPISSSLDIIKGINGVTFNWLADGAGAEKTVGVIAQDVTKVMPELVYPISGPDGNSYFGVHYDKLGPVLIEGIKEQQTQINTLLAQQSADSTLLSGLTISSDGTLSVPKLSADYLTLSSDVNFAATDLATLLNSTSGTVDVFSSLNSISTAVLGIQAQESSTSAKLANLESRVDTQESALTDLQTQVASTSATLSAAIAKSDLAIASLSAQLAQNTATSSSVIASEAAAISTSSNEIATSSSAPRDDATTLNLTPPSILLATGSATLTTGASAQLVDLKVTSDATVSGQLTAYDLNIQNSLKSFGNTTLGATLVAGDLTVDGTLSLTGSSLSTLGTLYIQSSSLAESVDLFNGLVTIDKAGKIVAQSIETPEVITNKLTISNKAPPPPAAAADPTIGSDKILAGTTKVAVLTNRVSATSKIFITPKSSTQGETPFVELIEPGTGLVVSIDQATGQDIDFDWWIVETR